MTTSSSKPSRSITARVIHGLITSKLTFLRSTYCQIILIKGKRERTFFSKYSGNLVARSNFFSAFGALKG